MPAAAHLRELGQDEVEGAGRGGDGQQGTGPDPLEAGQRLLVQPAGRGGGGSGCREQAVVAGDGVPGGGRQGQRLQQRHGGRQPLGADDRGGAGHGPVRAGQGGQRRQQLGEVEVFLPLGGGQLGEAEVGQPGQHVAVDHHVGRAQGAVGDPGPVQPVYFGPQPLEEVVADPLRRELAERAAVHPVHDQQRGPVAGLDHPVDAGDADAGPLGHHADEGLVLDRPDDRRGGPGVTDVAQPGEPVGPVEQVGVTLIRAEGLDEQPPPVTR